MNMIALVDQNWAIGKDGEQIVYIPSDLKFFRETTMGHPVILGRKTLATFPEGRPLKGRRNLILSRNPGFSAEGGEVFASLDALLAAAPEDSFVIGGASVYAALLEKCDTIYLTKISGHYPKADCFFPNLDARPEWRVVEEGPEREDGGVKFRYVTYKRA